MSPDVRPLPQLQSIGTKDRRQADAIFRYTVVVPILYTKTHFHFSHYRPRLLSLLHPPHRLDSIRILSLDVGKFDAGFSISPTTQVKEGTVTVTSNLAGLKESRVFRRKLLLSQEYWLVQME